MFSTLPMTNFNFSVTFILSSANAFNLDHSKFFLYGKEGMHLCDTLYQAYHYIVFLYTEPKKKLSQNRTSRWAYSLRKKKKLTPTSNETEVSNEINDFQTVHEL